MANGDLFLSGWEFSVSGGQISEDNPAYLSFDIGSGYASDNLSIWHFDGSDWTAYSASDLTYFGGYANFTVTSFSGYAISTLLPVPEPGSLAMLAGIALTALFYWWRKRA